jgi:hypothetical protein
MISFRIDYLIALGVVVVIAVYVLVRGRRKSPEELERERRQMLNEIGRITDGTVVDVQEINSGTENPATVLIYHYDVSGVSYEASQDVTYLRQRVNLNSCRLGVPASVRYDPQNPGNSMVVSETWSGIRG